MDERTCPRARDIDRHDRDIDYIQEHYVSEKVYQAALDRLKALESRNTNTWLSNRNALLAVASVIVGLIWSAYIAKGGGH
ncbi:MAG: hypothetical protein ACRDP6_00520 [Actinoallomurus sp.]